jgi:ABC-type sugar transport system permease subunit
MEQQIRTQLAPVSAATVVPRRSIRFASITPYLLIAPAFAVLFAVIVYPIVSNIWASFMGEATLSRPSEFVGLDQYRKVLDDPVF